MFLLCTKKYISPCSFLSLPKTKQNNKKKKKKLYARASMCTRVAMEERKREREPTRVKEQEWKGLHK